MKTIICVNIIYKALIENWSLDEINKEIKKHFGNYWSFTHVCQFLSGKEALKVLNSLEDDYLNDGLTKEKVKTILGLANSYCANALPHQTLSNGIKVKNFLNSNELEFKDKLESLLDRKLH